MKPDSPPRSDSRRGLAQGIGAYVLWGLLPVYFALLEGVNAGEVVDRRELGDPPLDRVGEVGFVDAGE